MLGDIGRQNVISVCFLKHLYQIEEVNNRNASGDDDAVFVMGDSVGFHAITSSNPIASSMFRAPYRLAPLRSALLRSAPLRSVPRRFAPLRLAPYRLAPHRFAPYRSAPLRLAPYRLAPLRSALLRSAPLRSVPLRFAPRRSHIFIDHIGISPAATAQPKNLRPVGSIKIPACCTGVYSAISYASPNVSRNQSTPLEHAPDSWI